MAFIKLKKVKPLGFSAARHKIDRVTMLWINSAGSKIYIADMPEQYLKNCIKMIEDGRHGSTNTDDEIYHVLKRELVWKDRFGRTGTPEKVN